MDLETEIPIWYNGKMKWISNLTTRSTCSDVIEAILSNDEHFHSTNSNDDYILYESWRGVERPLKARCRLLKLWHAWAGESSNVTLTLRTQQQQQSTSTHLLLRKQDKKLTKLKRQLKRTDKQIEKFTHGDFVKNSSSSYLHLYRSIINTQTQLEHQQKLISNLMSAIENENPHSQEFSSEDFSYLLANVNQTLMISRQLTEQSEELDQQIQRMNDEIDRKQYLLDELELDDALDQNIDLDSLDDEEQIPSKDSLFNQERVSTKDISPTRIPPPVVIPQKLQTVISSRPTAIVEPSLSLTKSKSFSESPLHKTRFHILPFSFRTAHPWSISPNEESDTGISSFNSTDDQLVTLV